MFTVSGSLLRIDNLLKAAVNDTYQIDRVTCKGMNEAAEEGFIQIFFIKQNVIGIVLLPSVYGWAGNVKPVSYTACGTDVLMAVPVYQDWQDELNRVLAFRHDENSGKKSVIAFLFTAVHKGYFYSSYIHLPIMKCDQISWVFSFCLFIDSVLGFFLIPAWMRWPRGYLIYEAAEVFKINVKDGSAFTQFFSQKTVEKNKHR